MILVTGATGTVGSEVLGALLERGVPVRALARTPQRAEVLRERTQDVVVGDLAEPSSLAAALDGVEAVFLVTPAGPDQVQLEGGVAEAVAAAPSRPRLVKLAALGYDAVPPEQGIRFGANHARVVQRIRDLGVPHTVLAPSGFTSNLLGSAATVREGALYGSSGDGALGWIDPRDIGAAAAAVLTGEGHEGASYDLTGPELLSHDQLAERLSAVVAHPVRYVDVPAEQFEQSLLAAGLDAWTAAALAELHQVYRAHQSEVVTDAVRQLTGRTPASVSDWLQRHRAAFA